MGASHKTLTEQGRNTVSDTTKDPEKTSPPQEAPEKTGIDWEDKSIPIGNAPPMPKWPAAIAAVVWAGWVVFSIG